MLPGASSTEGIAVGRGSTFYAGDILRGDIFRGDLQHGTAELFIDAPDGRMAIGMKVDVPSGLLFVAGGSTGQAYVYDTATGATVATYQLGNPAAGTSINDVAITARGRLVYGQQPTQAVLCADRARCHTGRGADARPERTRG